MLRDRYELQSLLGRGGMGTVYQALDRYRASLGLPDRHVALKIAAALPHGAGSRALGREFQSAQQLSHPNVINVYDIDHEGESSFYTMELLEGTRLSELLQPGAAPWPLRHALAIVRDVGAAVVHAHSRGIVHGDLKPQNVFVTHSGQVRVLDFGGGVGSAEPWIGEPAPPPSASSMRAHRLDDPHELGPFLAATPAYASCEQLEGQPADQRDDLFALACIAYQLFTGRHPFDGRSSLQARALRLRPARPAALRSEAWRALRHALAFDRSQRSLDIEAWLRDLGVAQAIEHLPPHWQGASVSAARPWGRRAATAAVLLIGLGAAAWLLQQQGLFEAHGLANSARSSAREAWQQIQTRASNALGLNPPTPAAPPTPSEPNSAPAAAPAAEPSSSSETATPAPAATPGESNAPPWPASPAPSNPARAADATAAAGAHGSSEQPASLSSPTGSVPQGAAAVTFSASRYDVAASAPAARIVVRRVGNSSGEVPFVWWTEAASAKPDVDYAPLGRRVELIPRGKHNVTIFVPIISNPLRQQPTQFYVALAELHASGQAGAAHARATVTIAPRG